MRADVIPISILTGFLGSGKTTILGYLLRQPEFSRTAVIINEFGEVGLDHELVETSEDSFIELQDRLPVLQNPHRPGANPSRHVAPA
jgi:adenylate kinase